VGLPYSLCAPVDLALLPHLYRLRVSLAPGSSVDVEASLLRLQLSIQVSVVTPQNALATIVHIDNLKNEVSVGTSYLGTDP
jgi:hypothetical protein